jgi:hypothetical protein
MQQFQPRIHHAQPLVVPRQILAFLAHDLTQPTLHLWVVYGVVVDPAFVARVVGRINVDAFHPALELGQQALQGFEVVAVDDPVVSRVGFAGGGKPVSTRKLYSLFSTRNGTSWWWLTTFSFPTQCSVGMFNFYAFGPAGSLCDRPG